MFCLTNFCNMFLVYCMKWNCHTKYFVRKVCFFSVINQIAHPKMSHQICIFAVFFVQIGRGGANKHEENLVVTWMTCLLNILNLLMDLCPVYRLFSNSLCQLDFWSKTIWSRILFYNNKQTDSEYFFLKISSGNMLM